MLKTLDMQEPTNKITAFVQDVRLRLALAEAHREIIKDEKTRNKTETTLLLAGNDNEQPKPTS